MVYNLHITLSLAARNARFLKIYEIQSTSKILRFAFLHFVITHLVSCCTRNIQILLTRENRFPSLYEELKIFELYHFPVEVFG